MHEIKIGDRILAINWSILTGEPKVGKVIQLTENNGYLCRFPHTTAQILLYPSEIVKLCNTLK